MRLFLRPIAARRLKCPPYFGIVILMTFVATLRIYGIASRNLYYYLYGSIITVGHGRMATDVNKTYTCSNVNKCYESCESIMF